jgi:uncharacterized membrane protein
LRKKGSVRARVTAARDRAAPGSGRTVMANSPVIAASEAPPVCIRRIRPVDLKVALAKGIEDFLAKPSHLAFLSLIYPIFLCLYALTFTDNALPLLYPLASGFALVGPVMAIGLYEVSRQRELGREPPWRCAFDVLRSPSIPSIVALGFVLMLILLCWLTTAWLLYAWLFGFSAPVSYAQFVSEVLTTSRGRTLIVLGNASGFIFAAVVLSISVVSFPLLLDRTDIGAATAVRVSVRAVLANPATMALWGLIVATLLVIGSLPLFVGLAVVMPILGHSTWHLYRRVVKPSPARNSPPAD